MLHETIQLYDERTDITLTTYVLDDSPEMLDGKKRPGVLVCPGGGYLGCSDREAEPVALRFAAMGYHAFVLRYSVHNNNETGFIPPETGDIAVNPNSLHPNPVRDIGRAFLIMHEYADSWLLDMEQIAICGFSAGGHNCAMYSVYWNHPMLTEHFDVDARLLRPAAAILGYAFVELNPLFNDNLSAELQMLTQASLIAFLGTTSPSTDLINEVSPVFHVTEHTPPTFLWATAADDIVPAEDSLKMAQVLAQNGIPYELHIFEQGIHGLSLANEATASGQTFIDADAAKWIDLVDVWLRKRFSADHSS